MNNMNKIYEGFEDAFDSSLIDYSHDFEANDKNHLKKQIEIWVELFLAPNRTTQWSKRNGILPYTINEDCTITLNTSFILFETAYSCLNYKLSKSRSWLETLSPDDCYEYPILWDFFLPMIKNEFTDIDITGSKHLNYLEKSAVSSFIMDKARYLSYDQINLYSGNNFNRENNWLYKIPDYINIASCYGDFTVRTGSRIKSMRGFPREIGGGFTISNLKSLAISNGGEGFKDGPIKVNGKIEAWHCDFTNEDLLAGFPKYCGFEINLTNNNLTSLDGLPEIIEADLVIDGNNLANLKGTVKCVKGSIDATLQQPDYKELAKFYREKYKVEYNVNITEDMLSRIMGPRGIKFFGVELRFGYNPPTDGYWKFEADYKNSENNMPIPKLIEGPENSAMLQGIRWWDPISKSGKEMRWIKEEKVNEGFEDIFDSSLIDYSKDVEKLDSDYMKKRYNFLKTIKEKIIFDFNQKRNWSWYRGGKIGGKRLLYENEFINTIEFNDGIHSAKDTIYLHPGICAVRIRHIIPEIEWITKAYYDHVQDKMSMNYEEWNSMYNKWYSELSDNIKNVSVIYYEYNWYVNSISNMISKDSPLWFIYKIKDNDGNLIKETTNSTEYKQFKTLNIPTSINPNNLFDYSGNILEQYKDYYNNFKKSIEFTEKASLNALLKLFGVDNETINQYKFNNKINEGFENAFDSSLIDYSDDFKEQDTKQAIINDIEKWIDFFVKTNSSDHSVEYRINDDLSIDLLNNKSGTLNKNFEFFCIKPFKQFQLHTLKNSKTIIYTDLTDNFGNPLPIDRLPDFINFRNVAGGFSCQGCDFTTLKGCPSGIVEGVYDCTHNNLENFDYLPKHCVSIDARWQRGKKLYNDKYIDFSSLVKSLNDRSIDPGDLIENWDETFLELWIPKTPKSMNGYETYLSPYIIWENKNSKRPHAICSLGTKTGEGTLGEWKYKDIKEIIQKHYPEKYEEFINKIK